MRVIPIVFLLFALRLTTVPTPLLAPSARACASSPEKLRAFAKTYGYIRYFHPSDQASRVDWNQFAVYAAGELIESPETESPEVLLTRLFDPLVVDLEFYRGETKPRPETKRVAASEILAWQHYGVGSEESSRGLYRSERTNRIVPSSGRTAPFGNLLQAVNVQHLRGREIRFRFSAKVDRPPGRVQGWFRVDRQSKRMGLFDNMGNRPIISQEWAEYELSGTVDDDAKQLTLGFMLHGDGSGLIDDARLQWQDGDRWKDIALANPDFEQGDNIPSGWFLTTQGYVIATESDDVAKGIQSVRLMKQSSTKQTGGIMELLPELGEVVDAEVCDGLRIRFPLALPAAEQTRTGDENATDDLLKRVQNNSKADQFDALAVGNVAVVWSTMQHFYPYFDQVETDWDAVLTEAMARAVQSTKRQDVTQTLRWLVAQLHDGHGNIVDSTEFRQPRSLPVSFSWVEDRLVVVASDIDEIQVGDIVTRLGGVDAESKLEQDETLISGSPQWKRYRSTSGLSMVMGEDPITVQVEREGETIDVSVPTQRQAPPKPKQRGRTETYGTGPDTIYYVDLGRVEPSEVNPMIDKFAKAKGIVFDLRGYPRGTQYLFQHLTDQHMQSAKWLVSKQVRPDRVDMNEFDKRGRWEMPPRKPRFQGKFVFLTDGSAISYAESCMAIVAHYKLGEIIGTPTAGANGNINPFPLVGGYRVIYTGMRVINHDDSQHHLLGVQPTIPMKPTLAGIRAGRDELVEQAIELIKAE